MMEEKREKGISQQKKRKRSETQSQTQTVSNGNTAGRMLSDMSNEDDVRFSNTADMEIRTRLTAQSVTPCNAFQKVESESHELSSDRCLTFEYDEPVSKSFPANSNTQRQRQVNIVDLKQTEEKYTRGVNWDINNDLQQATDLIRSQHTACSENEQTTNTCVADDRNKNDFTCVNLNFSNDRNLYFNSHDFNGNSDFTHNHDRNQNSITEDESDRSLFHSNVFTEYDVNNTSTDTTGDKYTDIRNVIQPGEHSNVCDKSGYYSSNSRMDVKKQLGAVSEKESDLKRIGRSRIPMKNKQVISNHLLNNDSRNSNHSSVHSSKAQSRVCHSINSTIKNPLPPGTSRNMSVIGKTSEKKNSVTSASKVQKFRNYKNSEISKENMESKKQSLIARPISSSKYETCVIHSKSYKTTKNSDKAREYSERQVGSVQDGQIDDKLSNSGNRESEVCNKLYVEPSASDTVLARRETFNTASGEYITQPTIKTEGNFHSVPYRTDENNSIVSKQADTESTNVTNFYNHSTTLYTIKKPQIGGRSLYNENFINESKNAEVEIETACGVESVCDENSGEHGTSVSDSAITFEGLFERCSDNYSHAGKGEDGLFPEVESDSQKICDKKKRAKVNAKANMHNFQRTCDKRMNEKQRIMDGQHQKTSVSVKGEMATTEVARDNRHKQSVKPTMSKTKETDLQDLKPSSASVDVKGTTTREMRFRQAAKTVIKDVRSGYISKTQHADNNYTKRETPNSSDRVEASKTRSKLNTQNGISASKTDTKRSVNRMKSASKSRDVEMHSIKSISVATRNETSKVQNSGSKTYIRSNNAASSSSALNICTESEKHNDAVSFVDVNYEINDVSSIDASPKEISTMDQEQNDLANEICSINTSNTTLSSLSDINGNHAALTNGTVSTKIPPSATANNDPVECSECNNLDTELPSNVNMVGGIPDANHEHGASQDHTVAGNLSAVKQETIKTARNSTTTSKNHTTRAGKLLVASEAQSNKKDISQRDNNRHLSKSHDIKINKDVSIKSSNSASSSSKIKKSLENVSIARDIAETKRHSRGQQVPATGKANSFRIIQTDEQKTKLFGKPKAELSSSVNKKTNALTSTDTSKILTISDNTKVPLSSGIKGKASSVRLASAKTDTVKCTDKVNKETNVRSKWKTAAKNVTSLKTTSNKNVNIIGKAGLPARKAKSVLVSNHLDLTASASAMDRTTAMSEASDNSEPKSDVNSQYNLNNNVQDRTGDTTKNNTEKQDIDAGSEDQKIKPKTMVHSIHRKSTSPVNRKASKTNATHTNLSRKTSPKSENLVGISGSTSISKVRTTATKTKSNGTKTNQFENSSAVSGSSSDRKSVSRESVTHSSRKPTHDSKTVGAPYQRDISNTVGRQGGSRQSTPGRQGGSRKSTPEQDNISVSSVSSGMSSQTSQSNYTRISTTKSSRSSTGDTSVEIKKCVTSKERRDAVSKRPVKQTNAMTGYRRKQEDAGLKKSTERGKLPVTDNRLLLASKRSEQDYDKHKKETVAQLKTRSHKKDKKLTPKTCTEINSVVELHSQKTNDEALMSLAYSGGSPTEISRDTCGRVIDVPNATYDQLEQSDTTYISAGNIDMKDKSEIQPQQNKQKKHHYDGMWKGEYLPNSSSEQVCRNDNQPINCLLPLISHEEICTTLDTEPRPAETNLFQSSKVASNGDSENIHVFQHHQVPSLSSIIRRSGLVQSYHMPLQTVTEVSNTLVQHTKGTLMDTNALISDLATNQSSTSAPHVTDLLHQTSVSVSMDIDTVGMSTPIFGKQSTESASAVLGESESYRASITPAVSPAPGCMGTEFEHGTETEVSDSTDRKKILDTPQTLSEQQCKEYTANIIEYKPSRIVCNESRATLGSECAYNTASVQSVFEQNVSNICDGIIILDSPDSYCSVERSEHTPGDTMYDSDEMAVENCVHYHTNICTGVNEDSLQPLKSEGEDYTRLQTDEIGMHERICLTGNSSDQCYPKYRTELCSTEISAETVTNSIHESEVYCPVEAEELNKIVDHSEEKLIVESRTYLVNMHSTTDPEIIVDDALTSLENENHSIAQATGTFELANVYLINEQGAADGVECYAKLLDIQDLSKEHHDILPLTSTELGAIIEPTSTCFPDEVTVEAKSHYRTDTCLAPDIEHSTTDDLFATGESELEGVQRKGAIGINADSSFSLHSLELCNSIKLNEGMSDTNTFPCTQGHSYTPCFRTNTCESCDVHCGESVLPIRQLSPQNCDGQLSSSNNSNSTDDHRVTITEQQLTLTSPSTLTLRDREAFQIEPIVLSNNCQLQTEVLSSDPCLMEPSKVTVIYDDDVTVEAFTTDVLFKSTPVEDLNYMPEELTRNIDNDDRLSNIESGEQHQSETPQIYLEVTRADSVNNDYNSSNDMSYSSIDDSGCSKSLVCDSVISLTNEQSQSPETMNSTPEGETIQHRSEIPLTDSKPFDIVPLLDTSGTAPDSYEQCEMETSTVIDKPHVDEKSTVSPSFEASSRPDVDASQGSSEEYSGDVGAPVLPDLESTYVLKVPDVTCEKETDFNNSTPHPGETSLEHSATSINNKTLASTVEHPQCGEPLTNSQGQSIDIIQTGQSSVTFRNSQPSPILPHKNDLVKITKERFERPQDNVTVKQRDVKLGFSSLFDIVTHLKQRTQDPKDAIRIQRIEKVEKSELVSDICKRFANKQLSEKNESVVPGVKTKEAEGSSSPGPSPKKKKWIKRGDGSWTKSDECENDKSDLSPVDRWKGACRKVINNLHLGFSDNKTMVEQTSLTDAKITTEILRTSDDKCSMAVYPLSESTDATPSDGEESPYRQLSVQSNVKYFTKLVKTETAFVNGSTVTTKQYRAIESENDPPAYVRDMDTFAMAIGTVGVDSESDSSPSGERTHDGQEAHRVFCPSSYYDSQKPPGAAAYDLRQGRDNTGSLKASAVSEPLKHKDETTRTVHGYHNGVFVQPPDCTTNIDVISFDEEDGSKHSNCDSDNTTPPTNNYSETDGDNSDLSDKENTVLLADDTQRSPVSNTAIEDSEFIGMQTAVYYNEAMQESATGIFYNRNVSSSDGSYTNSLLEPIDESISNGLLCSTDYYNDTHSLLSNSLDGNSEREGQAEVPSLKPTKDEKTKYLRPKKKEKSGRSISLPLGAFSYRSIFNRQQSSGYSRIAEPPLSEQMKLQTCEEIQETLVPDISDLKDKNSVNETKENVPGYYSNRDSGIIDGEVLFDENNKDILEFFNDDGTHGLPTSPIRTVVIPRNSKSSPNLLPDSGVDEFTGNEVTEHIYEGEGTLPKSFKYRRNNSFRSAQKKSSLQDSDLESLEDSVESSEGSKDERLCEEETFKNPNFFQRMLSRRKSFNDRFKVSEATQGKDHLVRKLSVRKLFRRTKSVPFQTSESDDVRNPPLAAFLDDEDIDSTPCSPHSSHKIKSDKFKGEGQNFARTMQNTLNLQAIDMNLSKFSNQMDELSPSESKTSQSELDSSFTTDDILMPAESLESVSSISTYAEIRECVIDEDDVEKPCDMKPHICDRGDIKYLPDNVTRLGNVTLSPSHMNHPLRPLSPKPPNVCVRRHRSASLQDSSSHRTSRDNITDLFNEISKTSVKSEKCNGSVHTLGKSNVLASGDSFRPSREQLQEQSSLETLVKGDMMYSNSNDSGIQRDSSIHSSNESIKVPQELAMTIRRRAATSPKIERPKSDITVRWADLLEQVSELEVPKRREGISRKDRPKSDLGGSSLISEAMKQFGSETSLKSSSSIRSLLEVRNLDKLQHITCGGINRRMSTPHPIKSRAERSPPIRQKKRNHIQIVRSNSMPECLDKVLRRRKLCQMLSSDDNKDNISQKSGDGDSSDESEFSVDANSLHEKSLSTRSSQVTLANSDETFEEENLIYAEALWDHVTMDPEELGFRAGDVIEVTDVTDKDWWWGAMADKEGWFPAAFVRLRVNQEHSEIVFAKQLEDAVMHSPKLHHCSCAFIDKDQARANVVNEIINAEREYVKHLNDVLEGYIKQMRKRLDMFPEDKISSIFGNMEEIYEFANKFLMDLESCINKEKPHTSEIGQCFLNHKKGFEIYSEYCNNHPSACEDLRELQRNKRCRHFFEACRLLQQMIEIPLEGFLLTPVQKICKYHLQLAELLKYTSPEHPDYSSVKEADNEMKRIAIMINERKRRMESIEKIASWQHSVEDWEGPDLLESSSELIYSGEVNKINSSGWSQERYFFLFDHCLIYCKKDLLKRSAFCYKGRVDIDNTEVVDLPDGRDNQFNLMVRNGWKLHDKAKDRWYLLYTKTHSEKQRWLKAFCDERRRVKEDQENDFSVPVHWRQKALGNMQKANQQRHKGKKVKRSNTLHYSYPHQTLVTLPAHATVPRSIKSADMSMNAGSSKKRAWFPFVGRKTKR